MALKAYGWFKAEYDKIKDSPEYKAEVLKLSIEELNATMKEPAAGVEVYNNGNGWRIAMMQADKRIIYTPDQAKQLMSKIKMALDRIGHNDR